MKIKLYLLLFLTTTFFFYYPKITQAANVADVFQVTSDESQQKDAHIYGQLIAYNNLTNIWVYNLETRENFPLIQKDGVQYITDLYKNLIVYQDIAPDSITGDIRLYNIETDKDTLIIGGVNSYSSGGTNGRYVIYLDGGACGNLYAYHIRKNQTQHIIDNVCTPKFSDNIVYWGEGAVGGSDIRGYDLVHKQYLDIAVEDGFQESADIFGNNVVWYQYTSGNYGTYQAIVMKNLKTGERKVIYETNTNSLQNPSISNRYVVWSESPSTHINSIKAADLKTGEVFEVQEAGSHQNSHTTTAIWKNTAVWMSWRTGNGDIYGARFKTVKDKLNSPQLLLLDNFNGPVLDDTVWEIFMNGGNISFAEGKITLLSGAAMPFIRTKNNPLPTSGPFTIEFGIQYLTRAEGGNGVAISFSQQPNVADTSMWSNNPLALWQDNVGFGLVGSGSYLLTISQSDFNNHIVKILYDETKYTVKIDENIVYTSPNTARVGGLWFGHPNYCCTSGWTRFSLDYIKITQP